MATGLTDLAGQVALRKRIYTATVLKPARDKSFFMGDKGMLGKGMKDATKPVFYVDELTKTSKGDSCVMPFALELDTDGIAGDNAIGNNVSAVETDYAIINIDRIRIPSQSIGKFSEQRTAMNFMALARDRVGHRYGVLVDEMLFQAASGVSFALKPNGAARGASSQFASYRFAADVTAPSTNRKIFAGTATSTATLTATDTMNWNLLVRARAFAEYHRISPIMYKNDETYIVVLHTHQAEDLKKDPDYKAALAHADKQGDSNKLFTGMLAAVDGLILYAHPKVCSNYGGTLWGSGNTVYGAQALLLGAQALAYAQIGEMEEIKPDQTDWGSRDGVGTDCTIGILKPKFKAEFITNKPTEDFSVVNIYTAVTNHA